MTIRGPDSRDFMPDDRTRDSNITGALAVVAAIVCVGIGIWIYDRSAYTTATCTADVDIEFEVVDALTQLPISGAQIDIEIKREYLVVRQTNPDGKADAHLTGALGERRSSRLGFTNTVTIYPPKSWTRVTAEGYWPTLAASPVFDARSITRFGGSDEPMRFRTRYELKKDAAGK
jgi:hypothetical protein